MAKTNGKRNKVAGSNWEREVVQLLHNRGLYDEGTVGTCRYNSKRLDDAGIDLMHLDEATHGMMKDSIQTKTLSSSPSYPKLLNRIREAGRPGPVIFHRQTSLSTDPKAKGVMQVERDRFAITYLDRYLNLMACEKFVQIIKNEIAVRESHDDEHKNRIWIAPLKDFLLKLGL